MGPSAAVIETLVQSHALAWALAACVLLVLVVGAFHWRLARARQRLKSRLHAAQTELHRLHGLDTLTGLVARTEFEAALDAEVVACDRSGRPLAVLVLGLDNFRQINDGYGHRAGDAVLVQAARRVVDAVGLAGEPQAVSRLSGDEFAIVLHADVVQASVTAMAVLQALHKPYLVESSLELQLTASLGVAVYPDHGSRPRLLGNATLAMRAVKSIGGAAHALYDPAMGVNHREQAELLQDLRQALERRQLQLYYQPKIDARSLQITAAEALLRWHHPRRGMISPAVFIPLAERHGLIAPIGRWVIEEACRQAAEWRELGLRMRVAVNISGHQLRQDDLVHHIETCLQRYAVRPERLTCEITETVAMEDTRQTHAAFERLRRAGLHVSIDDFGTGHSSLASLRKLPAAELKIDGAFVSDLASGDHARSIVQAVVQMARTLGLRVVAEGVETEAQRDALVALGCDELQGFLFAKPMTATSLALWAQGDDNDSGSGANSMFRSSLFRPTAAAPLES